MGFFSSPAPDDRRPLTAEEAQEYRSALTDQVQDALRHAAHATRQGKTTAARAHEATATELRSRLHGS